MTTHPYKRLPDHCFWQRAVTAAGPFELDPIVAAPFKIGKQDKVATAGSCFAQHIARHLKQAGLCFLETEPAHPFVNREEALQWNYGVYTARYGNIYSARQLLQLFHRAYGTFQPEEDVWHEGESWIDPFRPHIQPGGFSSHQEYRADRQHHFSAVRRAFESLDVLVFTFGMTEYWEAVADGAVFPLCPGVSGGDFSPDRHRLRNAGVAEVVADMSEFISLLRGVNPCARLLLSVSPVPLVATARAQCHVLAANTYSKSVLRVVCEELVAAHNGVAYLPSYEIITSAHSRGRYFGADLRSVNESGVAHVMQVFLRHFSVPADLMSGTSVSTSPLPSNGSHLETMREIAAVNCDEEAVAVATPPVSATCNLCGGHRFGPGPNGRLSPNGLLPHCGGCGSLERTRAMMHVVQNLIRPNRSISYGNGDGLDIGRLGGTVDRLGPGPANALAQLRETTGLYDFAALSYFFEFQRDDAAALDALLTRMTKDGIVLVCFIDTHTREGTANAGPDKGGVHRLYGRDVLDYFGCAQRGLAALSVTAVDPVTEAIQVLHFLFRDTTSSLIDTLRAQYGSR